MAPSAVNAVVALGGAAPMKVLANTELQNRSGPNASERSTRHIEVQLPAGVIYRVGDHLSVVPRNDPALVDSVARRFGFLPADQIRLQVAEGRRAQLPVGEAVSVGRLLTEFVELQQVATRKQIQIMSEHTRCPVTKPKLLAFVGDDAASTERYRTDILGKRKSVFDLLEEYPACELPFHAYLEMLSLLAPRYYSISSSPSVDAVALQHHRRRGRGAGAVPAAASTKASARIISPAAAPARPSTRPFAKPKRASVCPTIPSVPIIMIGPGTGLAPFRGFLQERAALKAKGAALGPAMLFFGCRHPEQDYLYADELKAFAADGITELHTAFSRGDGTEDLCAEPDRGAEGPRLGADRAGRDHLCLRRRRQDGAGRQGDTGCDLSRAHRRGCATRRSAGSTISARRIATCSTSGRAGRSLQCRPRESGDLYAVQKRSREVSSP